SHGVADKFINRDGRKPRVRIALHAQTTFFRGRHQPRRPPQAAISPGRPAPTTGPGTRIPRISPLIKFAVWMFRYVRSVRRAARNTGSAVAALVPKNGFPALPGGIPARLYVESAKRLKVWS